jgi:hypothetical protein
MLLIWKRNRVEITKQGRTQHVIQGFWLRPFDRQVMEVARLRYAGHNRWTAHVFTATMEGAETLSEAKLCCEEKFLDMLEDDEPKASARSAQARKMFATRNRRVAALLKKVKESV